MQKVIEQLGKLSQDKVVVNGAMCQLEFYADCNGLSPLEVKRAALLLAKVGAALIQAEATLKTASETLWDSVDTIEASEEIISLLKLHGVVKQQYNSIADRLASCEYKLRYYADKVRICA